LALRLGEIMGRFVSLWGRPAFIAKFHAVAAVIWLVIGVFGLVQYVLYLHHHHDPHAFSPIASSIPVLFFISVYANVVGHWSSYQAARVEVKQDEQIDQITS
jgi:hypothetical protein